MTFPAHNLTMDNDWHFLTERTHLQEKAAHTPASRLQLRYGNQPENRIKRKANFSL